MGGEGRDVVVGVDAACLDLGGNLRGVHAAARVFNLAAAVPYEGQLVILLVGRIVVQVLRGDDAALKMPTQLKVSGLARLITRVCMPPMERPAIARWAPSGMVRNSLSMYGIMSLRRISGYILKPGLSM